MKQKVDTSLFVSADEVIYCLVVVVVLLHCQHWILRHSCETEKNDNV